ncbi:hypothetical protein JKP88DRAFT_274729 [Tribonema minus]|uniref:Mediator of RNA polymerase II transcription subunit 21 n=1 Tax=Tribonema minus TaxID=303371 RepID=A0A835ZGR7_9STRA|nr:hypothetical protein JKP88DRAFT_274729 [Tribonema minus]
MTEAGDTAAAGGGPPAALSVIDDQIAAFRQDLNDAKEAIKAIYIAREATPPVPLPKYRTEEEQDRALDRLEAKEERLLRILDNLTSQRAQAQAQAAVAAVATVLHKPELALAVTMVVPRLQWLRRLVLATEQA